MRREEAVVMSLTIARGVSRKLRSTVMFVASFALVLGSVGFAAPQYFSQVARATGPTIVISNILELRNAVASQANGQADGQTWTINAGNYGLDRFNDITVEGQAGWYLPITANNLTINGVGNPILFGQEYSANGSWSSQNLVSVFGNDVTINGLTLMPKVEPNKTIEVLGNDFTIKNTTITPNTLIDQSAYGNISDPSDPTWAQDAKTWGGSLYFNHAGNHTVDNVTIKNAGVSFRYAPTGTHINFINTKLDYATNVGWINDYRYSSGFNNAGNTTTGVPKVTYDVDSTLNNLDSALASAKNGDTININSDISTAKQITVSEALTINGNGKTISPTFSKTDNSNNSVIGIQSNDVTINDLTVNGTGGTSLHGINVYMANGVNLNNVTTKNNSNNGLVVNSSTVAVSNINTSGNGWGGIDVDQKASPISSLTVNGQSTHSEAVADIYVDNTTRAVSVHDADSQYNSRPSGLPGRSNDSVYRLKLAAPKLVISSPTLNQAVNGRTVTIKGTATDTDFNYYYCYVSNVNGHEYGTRDASCNTTWHSVDTAGTLGTVTLPNDLPDGNYVAHLIAYDKARNVSEVTQAFVLDSTVPVKPTFTAPANNLFAKTNSVTLDWSNGDDAGTVQSGIKGYTVRYNFKPMNGGAAVEWTSGVVQNGNPKTLTGTYGHGEGTYTIYVSTIDNAGNLSPESDPLVLSYDATSPVVNITLPTSELVSGRTLNIEGTATDANFNYYYCYVTNANGEVGIRDPQCVTAWSAGSLFHSAFATTATGTSNGHLGAIDLAGLSSGVYQMHLVAYDKAGNKTESNPVSFTLDNDSPVLTVNPFATDTNQPTINGTLDDKDSDLAVMLDGTPLVVIRNGTSWSASVPTRLSDGTYTVSTIATDLAGNKTTKNQILKIVTPAAIRDTQTLETALQQIAPVFATTVAPVAPTDTTTADEAEVLGVSTAKDTAILGSSNAKKVAAIASSNDGNGFSTAWYWLLAIPAAIGAGWWAVAAYRRRDA